MNEKLLHMTLTNDTGTLRVGSGESIKIEYIEGIESAEYTVHTSSNATANGSTVTGKKTEERVITLVVSTDDDTNRETLRRELISFFNPNETIKMVLNYCGYKASIECEVTSYKSATELSLWDSYSATITFVCPYPYFADLDNFGKNIAATTPLFAFPLPFLTFNKNKKFKRGQVASFTTLTDEVVLNNKGHVPTGLEIVFYAKKGAVKNPKITNLSTGEFIEVLVDMKMGDEVRINTNEGKKNIYLNGKSIFKDKNKMSTFFLLSKGDNKVSYTAEQNRTNLEVRLYYTPKYLGV